MISEFLERIFGKLKAYYLTPPLYRPSYSKAIHREILYEDFYRMGMPPPEIDSAIKEVEKKCDQVRMRVILFRAILLVVLFILPFVAMPYTLVLLVLTILYLLRLVQRVIFSFLRTEDPEDLLRAVRKGDYWHTYTRGIIRPTKRQRQEIEAESREEERRSDVSFQVSLGTIMEVVRNKALGSEEWSRARELFIERSGGRESSEDDLEDTVDVVMLGYRDAEEPAFRSYSTETIMSALDSTERRSALRDAIKVAAADGIISTDELASLEYVAEQLGIDEETLDTIMQIEVGAGRIVSAGPAADEPDEHAPGAQEDASSGSDASSEQAPQESAADDAVSSMAAVLMAVVKLKDLGSPEWVHARRFLSERATISEAEADVRLLQASGGKIDASLLAEGERIGLLREAVDLAALDGTVDEDERSALIHLAGGLGTDVDVVGGLIQIALAESQKAVEAPEAD